MNIPQIFQEMRFITPAQFIELTGLKKTTAYKVIHQEIGPYRFSPRRLSLLEADVLKWIETKKTPPCKI